jgi:hypothetical protein
MRRCFTCAKPFGLVRHYHFNKQFCSERCKSRFLQRREQQIAQWRDGLTCANLVETIAQVHQPLLQK